MAHRHHAGLRARWACAMSSPIEHVVRHEWASAAAARRAGDLDCAFAHLERAHIVGHRHTWQPARAYCGMLAIGWHWRDRREIVGQLGRITALLCSRLWVPVGKTGGANVSPFTPMPLPDDLRALIDGDGA